MRDVVRHGVFVSVLLALILLSAACHKKKVVVPAPAQPAPAATAPEKTDKAPATTTPSSTTPSQPSTQTPAPKDVSPYQRNRPPEQPASPRRASRPATPLSPTPAPPTSGPTPPPAVSPPIGDILTPEQQRQFNSAIDQSLAQAQAGLSSVSNRQLSKQQQDTVAQVLNFIRQAQETRKSDLPAARSLAERAEVLARDLVASLR